ncbi:MAG TPA: hypothetical protein VMB27_09595 [Solirubrobacteraceae bacterium]|nr:hypothetical protein [Solirubrobacteraceae bacterium]
MLGLGKILQPVKSEVAHAHRRPCRTSRIVGQQHLAPVRDRHHTRRSMNVHALEATPAHCGRAGMNSHPDPGSLPAGPDTAGQGQLHAQRTSHRIASVCEHGEE